MNTQPLIVGIAGVREKRHLLFAILRYMGSIGRTVIISQNRTLKFLSKELEGQFIVKDTEIIVCEGSFELLEAEDEDEDENDMDSIISNLGSYNYVIFDIVDEIPSCINKLVVLDFEEYYLQELLDMHLIDVEIILNGHNYLSASFDKVSNFTIPPAWQYGDLIVQMMEKGELVPTKIKNVETALTTAIAKILDVSPSVVDKGLRTTEVTLQ